MRKKRKERERDKREESKLLPLSFFCKESLQNFPRALIFLFEKAEIDARSNGVESDKRERKRGKEQLTTFFAFFFTLSKKKEEKSSISCTPYRSTILLSLSLLSLSLSLSLCGSGDGGARLRFQTIVCVCVCVCGGGGRLLCNKRGKEKKVKISNPFFRPSSLRGCQRDSARS